jgi:hypothetical protein
MHLVIIFANLLICIQGSARGGSVYRSLKDSAVIYHAGATLFNLGNGIVKELEGGAVIKCDKTKSLEEEAVLMKLFPRTSSFFLDTATREGDETGSVCIVMRRLGESLEARRDSDGERPWSWGLLANIGIVMLDILEDFHKRGFAHMDFHCGNILLHPSDPSVLIPIDLGDAHQIVSDKRSRDVDYVKYDLKQALVSLRFLLDGNRAFFAAKRVNFRDGKSRGIISAGAPRQYLELIDYVDSIESLADVDYDRIRAGLLEMLGARKIRKDHVEWK